jgi:hypothetical protein
MGLMATPEPDEAAHEVPEVDPINTALCPLLMAVLDATEMDSPQRAEAMNLVLELPAKIRAAISRPRLN